MLNTWKVKFNFTTKKVILKFFIPKIEKSTQNRAKSE